jgi:hypothetical protein
MESPKGIPESSSWSATYSRPNDKIATLLFNQEALFAHDL